VADGAIWGWLGGAIVAALTLATVPGCERAAGERSAAARLDAVPVDVAISLSSAAVPDGGVVDERAVCVRGGRRPDITWSGLPDGTAEVAVIVDVIDRDGDRRVHDIVLRLDPDRAGWFAGGPHTGGDAPVFVAPCHDDATAMRVTVVALRAPLPAGIDSDDDTTTVLDGLADLATAQRTITATFHR
jgi:hypothetical protein